MPGRKFTNDDPDGLSWTQRDDLGSSKPSGSNVDSQLPFEVMPQKSEQRGLAAPRIPNEEDRPSIDEPALPETSKRKHWESTEEATQIDFAPEPSSLSNAPVILSESPTRPPSIEVSADRFPTESGPKAQARATSSVITLVPDDDPRGGRSIVIGPTDGNWNDDAAEAKTLAPGMIQAIKLPKPPKSDGPVILSSDEPFIAASKPSRHDVADPSVGGSKNRKGDDSPAIIGPPKNRKTDDAPLIVGPPKNRKVDDAPIIVGPPKNRNIGEIRETRRSPGSEAVDARLVGPAFRVKREIAVGGMGTVYEAERVADRKRVALKVLNANVAKDDRIKERLKREVEAARKLGHPGTVEMYGFETAPDGRAFAVMELLEGIELRGRIRERGKLAPGEALPIAIAVLEVLAAAHAKGIIHRDVKPENIFLAKTPSGEERVKLLDFGAANVLDAKTLTVEGSMIGTPAYMAPEQVLGEEISERTDVYCLAVVLYEALSGQQPFRTDRFEETIVRVVSMVPPPPVGIALLDEIVLKALEKRPENRWPTANAFAKALADSDASRGLTGTFKLAWSRRLRSKTFQRVAAVSALAGIAVAAGYFAGDRGTTERLALAVRPADVQGCLPEEVNTAESLLREALKGVPDVSIIPSDEAVSGVVSVHISCSKESDGLALEASVLSAEGGKEENHIRLRAETFEPVAQRLAFELATNRGWRTSPELRKAAAEAKLLGN